MNVGNGPSGTLRNFGLPLTLVQIIVNQKAHKVIVNHRAHQINQYSAATTAAAVAVAVVGATHHHRGMGLGRKRYIVID